MTAIVAPKVATRNFCDRLDRFMRRPQRHRLLHGFPLAAAMLPVNEAIRREQGAYRLVRGEKAPLLVGVLPHPFCNPKLEGCGYCTFQHEAFNSTRAEGVVSSVIEEIRGRLTSEPLLSGAGVDGLYFGGGTANLTPQEPFRRLSRMLNRSFDLTQAEVSLEGVPVYFVRRKPFLIDIMREEIQARHFRISMGIQTFSESRLRQMGREAFGGPATFAEAVQVAQARGLTTSGDLLFNLPGQSLAEMKEDVRRAVDLGLDQICLYHLVMFRGLGTPWARDPELLARLPDNEHACSNWVALRQELLDRGYRQTSLTNFERADLAGDPRSYRYEPLSFDADPCRVVGFGPGGISHGTAPDGRRALKTMNPNDSGRYVSAVRSGVAAWDRFYRFDSHDLRLLQVTRRLAGLALSEDVYWKRFDRFLEDDFADELELLIDRKLLKEDSGVYRPTPRGMFYSDSMAGLFAERHLRVRRELLGAEGDEMNTNAAAFM